MRVLWLGILLTAGCGKDGADGVDTDAPVESDTTESDAVDTDDTDAPDTDDTDVVDTDDTDDAGPTVVSCGAPTSVGRCDVVAGTGGTLWTAGAVLAPDAIYVGGQVAVDEAGLITCVGCDCDAGAGATTITCGDGVLSPGLLNLHDHMTYSADGPVVDDGERYESREDWRRGTGDHDVIVSPGSASADQLRWNELRHLLAGTTSIAGSGTSAGLVRNLDRTGAVGDAWSPVKLDTLPLGASDDNRLASGCDYPELPTPDDFATASAYLPHLGEGIDDYARNEFGCVSGTAAGSTDVLGDRTGVMLGVALDATELALAASRGTALIWSPRSNLRLYGDTADVRAAHRLGVNVALGTDWAATGSMNLLRELRCAASFDDGWLDDALADVDLWRMVTGNPADAAGADGLLGALVVGAHADLAVFDGAGGLDHGAVVGADPEDVVLVARDGLVLYGDADAVAALRGEVGCDALDVCGVPHAVCLADEIGRTLEQLTVAAGSVYPAFACGEPVDEPTCVPQRPEAVDGGSTYTGLATAGDGDGDGVPDAGDLCPAVFDPIRPGTGGLQADVDEDGLGDACDPCPVDVGACGP